MEENSKGYFFTIDLMLSSSDFQGVFWKKISFRGYNPLTIPYHPLIPDPFILSYDIETELRAISPNIICFWFFFFLNHFSSPSSHSILYLKLKNKKFCNKIQQNITKNNFLYILSTITLMWKTLRSLRVQKKNQESILCAALFQSLFREFTEFFIFIYELKSDWKRYANCRHRC